MNQKNYYQILQVPPSATTEMIKKAYRKLALQYHPDVTNNNADYTKHFTLIKEAYEVLINTDKRRKFHTAFFFNKKITTAETIQDVIVEATKIETYINHTNRFKLDYELINYHVEILLSEPYINIIHQNNQHNLGQQLHKIVLGIMEVLPYVKLIQNEKKFTRAFEQLLPAYQQLMIEKKQQMLWDKYAVVVAISLAIGLCCMIALLS